MRFLAFRGVLGFLVVATAVPGLTLAQDAPPAPSSDIVLLVPADVRAEWTAAVQIELAPRGARAIPLEPPTADTTLLRDAEAQRLAREHNARAAARVETTDAGLVLRVIERDASEARSVPLAREADARTVALILISMLDEPAGPAPSSVPPPPVAVAADTGVAALPPPPPSHDAADGTDTPAEEEASEGGLHWFGRIGTGGFALINDRRFIPGAMIRGGTGLRLGYFESALLADVALMIDQLSGQGTEVQPLGRLCLDVGAAIPLGSSALHTGARGCVGFAELRTFETGPLFDPFPFAVDRLGWLGTGGGYLAISFRLSDSKRLFIRADVEYARLEASMHAGEVFAGLSVLLGFGA